MNGKGIIDFLIGTSTTEGMLKQNENDTEYRQPLQGAPGDNAETRTG